MYRARDTRLKRDVAVKVLPETFTHDPDRLARFQREAELLATLNHPNIAAIHGLEIADGMRALVLELVDGETLAERIARGPVPVDEALPIAGQIAGALDAAQELGVIHRDLKPANIKVRPDGTVKVLDFGLAKFVGPPEGGYHDRGVRLQPDLTVSPTLSVAATRLGVILGTASYMSPEQARGKAVDRRTDIWAFGCVLFEMLAGKQAFAATGDTVSDTVAAILRGEPDWGALPADTSAAIRRLLRRCLAKDSRERLRDVGDAQLEIDEARVSAPPAEPSPRRRIGMPRLATAALALVLIALAVPATLYFTRPGPDRLVTRLDVVVPGVDPGSLALSPDGRQLAYVAFSEGRSERWIRSFDRADARALPGTDQALLPFWSPDGRAIGFFAAGKLKRLDLTGGTVETLVDAPVSRGGSWNQDGTILFAPAGAGPLMRIAATGGAAVPVANIPGEWAPRWPQFLPDGRRFLFFVFTGDARQRGVYLGFLEGAAPVRLLDADSAAAFVPPRWLLVVRQGLLMAFPFDLARGVITGDPTTMAQPVGANPTNGRAMVTAAGGDILIYGSDTGAQRRQLVWRDRAGRTVGGMGQPDDADVASISLSPDGRRVATSRSIPGNQDVWLIDVARGVPSRLTFNASPDNAPIWTADGDRVIFRSLRSGNYELFEKAASGAGEEQPLSLPPGVKIAYDASSDGRSLLYGILHPTTGADIWALPLTRGAKPFPVVQTPFAEDSAQFSPDGRWVAYESNESGQFEIYVQAFPTSRGKWQVSTAGGIFPRWRQDGKELFYIDPNGRLTAVSVTVASDQQSIDAGTPLALFTTRLASGGSILSPGGVARPLYAVAADGRFLLNEAAVTDQAATAPLRLVLNWDAELR